MLSFFTYMSFLVILIEDIAIFSHFISTQSVAVSSRMDKLKLSHLLFNRRAGWLHIIDIYTILVSVTPHEDIKSNFMKTSSSK